MAKYIFLTRQYIDMNVQVEQDYNKWYWEEHIPALCTVPGVLGARRYHTVGNVHPDAPPYVAIYDLESPEVVESFEWHENAEASEWGKRVNMHMKGNPGVYERIFPLDVDDSAPFPTAEFIYLTRMTPTPAGEEEFNQWYNEYHIPEMTAVTGVLSGRRFKRTGKQHRYAPKYVAMYELVSDAVPASEEWKTAGYTKRSADVLGRTRVLKSVPGVYQLMRRPAPGK